MKTLPNQGSPELLHQLLRADEEALRSIRKLEETSDGLRRIALLLRANLAARLPRYSPTDQVLEDPGADRREG